MTNAIRVRCVPLPHAWVDAPTYKTEGSAGMDLYATAQVMIHPGKTQIIPTGIQLAIPSGYEGQIRPRSSTLRKHGSQVEFGTIDASPNASALAMPETMIVTEPASSV